MKTGIYPLVGDRHERTASPGIGTEGPRPCGPHPQPLRRRYPRHGSPARRHQRRNPLRRYRVGPARFDPHHRRGRLQRTPRKKSGYAGSTCDCPQCGHAAGFHDYRSKTIETVGGGVTCCRAYYYCRTCGHGFAPWDGRTGLKAHRLSPAVERLATLCGAVADSFGKGRELLRETTGIRLSESTVQRTTEAVGQRIAAHLQKGRLIGPKQAWDWHRDGLGDTVGYIAIDATGVRQQGPHGEKAEGRMAYVGMIFNPLPDRERVFEDLPKPGTDMQARYVSGLYPLADMELPMRRQAAQVGLDKAQTWVALSDGGSGLEEFLRGAFPRATVILDFYHASEYLAKLSTALHPADEAAALEQTKSWSRLLRDEGGELMLAVLREWDWPARQGLVAVRAEVLTYFENQVHRMDYPTYEANGWFIGSGAVESACKTVVGQRLKGSGMRWSEPGGDALCHVRALYRSEHGQWNAFWQPSLAA
ncbi:MAG: ISKra4 family transposase [Actinobacteria bacterium]|nr:ISKra4 family transposase [Actinomycetota bacterium]